MIAQYLYIIAQALPPLFSLFAFRTFPFAIYTIFSKHTLIITKVIAIAFYACLIVAAYETNAMFGDLSIRILVSYSYFAFVTFIIYFCNNALNNRFLILFFVAFTYVFIPSVFVFGHYQSITQLIGWEMMLASYSYCLDSTRGKETLCLKECLFFILVDPTLVLMYRSQRVFEKRKREYGCFRIILGTITMILHRMISAALLLLKRHFVTGNFLMMYLGIIALTTMRFSSIYFSHSAIASYQIGILRLLGYKTPERYHYPFLSRSPIEFWRRWNIYISNWARCYLFYPLSRYMIRKKVFLSRNICKGTAIVATLAIVGLMHDVVTITHSHRASAQWTMLFITNGFLIIIWLVASRTLSSILKNKSKNTQIATSKATGYISWIMFMHYVMLVIVLREHI